jgi:hypothetical protein
MTDILTHQPIPAPPQAKLAAAELIGKVNSEILRRAGEHIDGWRAFWEHPQATAAEIAAEMNGDAERFFRLSEGNLQAIAAMAAIVGRPVTDFVPIKYTTRPQTVMFIGNGYVQIGS